jgi:methylglutaconyl-CoA hydratase
MEDVRAGSSEEELVVVEPRGDYAWLWLNRPEAHNALGPGLVSALQAALENLAVERPRALVIGGNGPSFCAGADIKWMRESADLDDETRKEDALSIVRLLDAIDSFPAPVIVRAHGTIAGGGNGLVCAADIAIADDDATFTFAEVKVGILPATIAPYVVRRIGVAKATALWMTGERFDGKAAERFGLVDRAVGSMSLDGAIDDVLAERRTGGPSAQGALRALARQAAAGPSPDLGVELAELNARMRASDEGREGLQAFLERRKPGWAE